MKLILTRHGETEENKAGITQGQTPGTLTESGKQQARMLAERFKDEKIDAIYSSDLGRAADTAKEIAKYHPNIPFNLTTDLRERDTGEFTGKKIDFVGWEKASKDPNSRLENLEQVKERGKKAIDKSYEKYPNGTVLFMGHGGVNAAIISAIMNKGFQEVFDMEDWKNTNVSIFEIYEDKSHKIHCLNCARHLEQNN